MRDHLTNHVENVLAPKLTQMQRKYEDQIKKKLDKKELLISISQKVIKVVTILDETVTSLVLRDCTATSHGLRGPQFDFLLN